MLRDAAAVCLPDCLLHTMSLFSCSWELREPRGINSIDPAFREKMAMSQLDRNPTPLHYEPRCATPPPPSPSSCDLWPTYTHPPTHPPTYLPTTCCHLEPSCTVHVQYTLLEPSYRLRLCKLETRSKCVNDMCVYVCVCVCVCVPVPGMYECVNRLAIVLSGLRAFSASRTLSVLSTAPMVPPYRGVAHMGRSLGTTPS